jgi:hypothetical protein
MVGAFNHVGTWIEGYFFPIVLFQSFGDYGSSSLTTESMAGLKYKEFALATWQKHVWYLVQFITGLKFQMISKSSPNIFHQFTHKPKYWKSQMERDHMNFKGVD